mgnify:CR=1 FL=1
MYGNCLLSAIKAKVKNPKVHIIKVPKKAGGSCTHFMWFDGEKYYHASGDGFILWHKIKTKEISQEAFNSFILSDTRLLTTKEKEKIFKKLYLKINGLNRDWTTSRIDDQDLPKEEDYNFLKKVLHKEPLLKVILFHDRFNRDFKIMKLSELLEVNKTVQVDWKWLGPLDEEFPIVYNSTNVKADDLN